MAVEELVAFIEDGAMKAWEHLVDRIQAHPAAENLLGGMDFEAFAQVSGRVVEGVGEQVALDSARRLAVARFDDAVVAALDGVVQAEGGLPEGDIVVHTHVPAPQQRLAVWTALLAGLRAATR